MREQRYGRIVNMSSGAGQLSDMGSGFPAYRMSKAALNALTRITAAELRDTNIKVNAVCPGWVRTEMGGPNTERSVEQGAGLQGGTTLPHRAQVGTGATRHLEIETYTWNAPPAGLKRDLLESIAREYEWVLSTLPGRS